MKKTLIAAAMLSASALTMSANATLIAYWNFNDYDTSATNLAADHGTGNISLANYGGAVTSFAGSPINTLFDDPSGGSLSLQTGGTELPGNGTWIDITFSMSGLQDLVMTFAGRGTGTGYSDNQVSWSTDGMNFANIGGPYDSTHTDYILYDFDFGSLLDDAADVTIRITFDGATGGSGNNRIDNLQLNASVIPAPGVLALLGVAGLVGTHRRRNN